jgi:hypothetical protein
MWIMTEGMGKEEACFILRYYPAICLEKLRRNCQADSVVPNLQSCLGWANGYPVDGFS